MKASAKLKRPILMILMFALCASLGSCKSEPGPKEALEQFLKSQVEGRAEQLWRLASSADQAAIPREEFLETSRQLAEKYKRYRARSFTIDKLEVQGDKATAEVEITSPDPTKKVAEGEALPMITTAFNYRLIKESSGWRINTDWATKKKIENLKAEASRLSSAGKDDQAQAIHQEIGRLQSTMTFRLKPGIKKKLDANLESEDSSSERKDLEALQDSIEKLGKNRYRIPRSKIPKFTEKHLQLARMQPRIIPAFKEEKPYGFKLFGMPPDSLYARIGLTNGDVITHINGIPATSPNKIGEALKGLDAIQTLEVKLQRKGQPTTIHIQITQ